MYPQNYGYKPQKQMLEKSKEEVIRNRILKEMEDVDEVLGHLYFLVDKFSSKKEVLKARLPN